MTISQKIYHLNELLRFKSCFLGTAFVLLSVYLGDTIPSLLSIVLAALIVFAVIGFSFLINDLCDLELDRIAKPHRPLVAGTISIRTARLLLVGLAGFALVCAGVLGPFFVLFTFSTLALASIYSLLTKRTILLGHLTVALLNASILLFGGLLVGRLNNTVLIVGIAVFLYTFAHEILYAIEDYDGDRLGGVKTTATLLGIPITLKLFYVPAGLLALLAPFPAIRGDASVLYGVAALLCCSLPLLWILVQLQGDPEEDTIRRSRQVLIGLRFLGLIPVLLLKPF